MARKQPIPALFLSLFGRGPLRQALLIVAGRGLGCSRAPGSRSRDVPHEDVAGSATREEACPVGREADACRQVRVADEVLEDARLRVDQLDEAALGRRGRSDAVERERVARREIG